MNCLSVFDHSVQLTIKVLRLFLQNIKKTNPNMCILMYFEIQSYQPRIAQNALKSQIFELFTKPSSGHK